MSNCAKNGFCRRFAKSGGGLSRRISLRHMAAISILCHPMVDVLCAQSAAAGSSEAVGAENRWKNLGTGVLKDTRTTLEWLQDDSGEDIDWSDAKSYCDGKRNGWRLPSLQELRSIYDEHEHGVRCAQTICKVSSQFHLTGTWFWSATQVGKDSADGIELAWGVLMANGAQTQAVREASYGSHALCVRGP